MSYYDRNRDKILAARRERRASDPEFREKEREQRKAWAERNPRKKRGYDLKTLYGITIEEYEALLEVQEGKCAICGASPDDPKHHREFLDVDHTGERGKNAVVRGLLCSPCNLGIGKFCDDPELLEQAAEYVREFREV